MRSKIVPFICLILFPYIFFGQRPPSASTWESIEKNIIAKKNLTETANKLFQIKSAAVQQHDEPAIARAMYYNLLITDLKTEDTLYFKNARFIDSILKDPLSPPLIQSIMLVLKAKRIQEFTNRFFYQKNKTLFASYDPVLNYGQLTRPVLDSLVQLSFARALHLTAGLNQIEIEDLLWLSSDPLIFLFKPDLADIIFYERIKAIEGGTHISYFDKQTEWLSRTQDDFIQLLDEAGNFTAKEQPIFSYYRQWMLYHTSSQPEAYYFIETLARKYFYSGMSHREESKGLYEKYLLSLRESKYSTVKANGIYQLGLLWRDEGSNYNPWDNQYYADYKKTGFNEKCRLDYKKVLNLMADHDQLFDSFPYIKHALLLMKRQIMQPEIRIELAANQLPSQPILAFLKFRNVKQLYTRVVKVNAFETIYENKKIDAGVLLRHPLVRESIQALNLPDDYQLHNTYLRIDPLPAGRYIIFYSDSAITEHSNRVDYTVVSVSNIAVINNDQRVFVLDRKTGFPLKGATVLSGHSQTQPGSRQVVWVENPPSKVNADGYVIINEQSSNEIKIINKKDSIGVTINNGQTYKPEYIYDSDEYDDVLEYYEDNIKLYCFTDRAIYRPGQTVYYKGIFITRNPRTGDPLVLSWKNLKISFFKKLFYRIASKFSNEKIEVTINDAFGRAVDTIRVIPDQFGSFSGSLTIPKDAATGEWDFDTDFFDIDYQNSHFSVEEYKRPTFELSIGKPKTEINLTDSFPVTVKVSSFAGARLTNTLIKYSVTRSGDVPVRNDRGFISKSYQSVTLMEGRSHTNHKGELVITINDSLLRRYQFPNDQKWSLRYSVEAEAIDETGESHEQEINLEVSNRPVSITFNIPPVINRDDIAPVYISTASSFEGPVTRNVDISLCRLESKHIKEGNHQWPATDIWLYSRQQLQNWFGDVDFSEQDTAPEKKKLIFHGSFLAGAEKKWDLPKELLTTGEYQLIMISREDGKINGEANRNFAVFDKREKTFPGAGASFHYMQNEIVEKGKEFSWIAGTRADTIFSIYHLAYYEQDKKAPFLQNKYYIIPEKKGLNEERFTMPANAAGDVRITHLYITGNHLYRTEKTVSLPYINNNHPEIIISRYRKKLTPGGRDAFTLSIKTKSKDVIAQVMTTMYDASLDKLEPHRWELPALTKDLYARTEWDWAINEYTYATYSNNPLSGIGSHFDGSLIWWLDLNKFTPGMVDRFFGQSIYRLDRQLQGRVSGVSVSSPGLLEDVVVVGYGTTKRLSVTGALVAIRGNASVSEYKDLLIIIDGEIFSGDISSIKSSSIVEGRVLKGADATALYGARAAKGVVLISTKGPLKLPAAEQPAVVVRKNFAESAFFYPKIYADRNGVYTINFTLPESVTKWKWKILAHTKKAVFTYAERELYSQLPLMVQPSMPRFLYQGDKIILKSRITNLDSISSAGTLQCIIEDVVTGEDISQKLVSQTSQHFSVKSSSNTTGSFVITVPADLLHPLRIKITASAEKFSDGEEYTIPILSKKMLVSLNVPLSNGDEKKMQITTPALPDDAAPYGIGLFINPKPQAAMVKALPYLANYPYNCAEQTFNKLLAYSVSVKIARLDSLLQKRSNKPVRVPKEDTHQESLPDDLSEETMPWLQLSHSNQIHQRQLSALLDTLQSRRQVEKYLRELEDLQNSDGGITWFKGGESSPYISFYILGGFGKLEHDQLPFLFVDTDKDDVKAMLSKLISYCDDVFAGQPAYVDPLQYLYARSYWLKSYPVAANIKSKVDSFLTNAWTNAQMQNPGRKAFLITATLRYSKKESLHYRTAMEQISSIRQLAVEDSLNGIRWKSISDDDDLTTQTEEWIVKIAEAFEQAENSGETVSGIIKWLLQAKSEHTWSTTKSTADIVSLLSRHQPKITGKPEILVAEGDNLSLQVTDDLLKGSSFAFTNTDRKPFPSKINIQRSASVSGGVTYYYFTARPPENKTIRETRISKTLFRYNNGNNRWEPIGDGSTLRIADKIKTVLTIQTKKQLRYVFINDRRPAALEPADGSSGYEYNNGFSYYRSVRDAAMQFFAETIPAGISTISYETVVSKEGVFSDGITSLQCMYRPTVRAYCTGQSLRVIE